MKKILFAIIAFAAIFNSCSTDFDLTAKYKEVMVVYGLLNIQDTEHYIRIEKAFLDESTSALLISQNPDSIYYEPGLEVIIRQLNSSGGEDGVLYLERVNGDTLGMPKDSGIFANSPNILYRFKTPDSLKEDHSYQLEINNPATGKSVRSQTPLVNDFQFLFPSSTTPWNPASPTPLTVQWRSAKNGKVYDLIVRFHYEEWDKVTPNIRDPKFIDLVLARNIEAPNLEGGSNIQLPLSGEAFYLAVKSKIPVNPLVNREVVFPTFDFLVNVGGEELYNYIRVNQSQLGITSQSAVTTYTNIENGLGIFSSRYFKVQSGIDMHPNGIDTLACGHITLGLGFLDAQSQDFCQ